MLFKKESKGDTSIKCMVYNQVLRNGQIVGVPKTSLEHQNLNKESFVIGRHAYHPGSGNTKYEALAIVNKDGTIRFNQDLVKRVTFGYNSQTSSLKNPIPYIPNTNIAMFGFNEGVDHLANTIIETLEK